MLKQFTLLLVFLSPYLSTGQRIDNTPFYRDSGTDEYFRFTYENDYFGQSDYYYSQGFNFELGNRLLHGNPVNVIFPKLKNGHKTYSLALEHNVFTPVTISADSILREDRPYSATFMIKFALTTSDTIRHSRLSAVLSVGAIGSAAYGQEMQTGFQQFLGTTIPEGWEYQIRNDFLLSYELKYEQQLLRLDNYFSMHAHAKLQLGTINTNAAAGLSGAIGKINFPYDRSRKSQFLIYAYGRITGMAIAYDATLQGGLINKNSPYVIRDSDLTRVSLQQDFGIVIQWKRLYFEYSRSELTKEFRTGDRHRWGGIRFAYQL